MGDRQSQLRVSAGSRVGIANPIRGGQAGGHRPLLRRGIPSQGLRDLYHLLLTLSWPGFLGLLAGGYILSNVGFALLYLLGSDNIANARPGHFGDAFFFSVQTLASIGYGAMYPHSLYAHLLVTLEAMLGVAGTAVATGLVFARISRPTARVMFTRVAVIHTQEGCPTLMFRAANQRFNQIVEAQIRVTLACNQISAEGEWMRRLYDLRLVRSMSPIFAVTWTIMHRIEPDSPLYGLTPQDLEAGQAELIITLTGIDDTFSQTIHARYSYLADEIRWGHRFADILHLDSHGNRYVDYSHFHTTLPI
ncbi:MAG: ion channel [Thermostichus sp. DG02_5_bins_236]